MGDGVHSYHPEAKGEFEERDSLFVFTKGQEEDVTDSEALFSTGKASEDADLGRSGLLEARYKPQLIRFSKN